MSRSASWSRTSGCSEAGQPCALNSAVPVVRLRTDGGKSGRLGPLVDRSRNCVRVSVASPAKSHQPDRDATTEWLWPRYSISTCALGVGASRVAAVGERGCTAVPSPAIHTFGFADRAPSGGCAALKLIARSCRLRHEVGQQLRGESICLALGIDRRVKMHNQMPDFVSQCEPQDLGGNGRIQVKQWRSILFRLIRIDGVAVA
jgi:hypothetical protein